MNKTLPALVGLLIIGAVGAFVFLQPQNPGTAMPRTESPTGATPSYTLNEVSAHVTANDCWSAINGGVYDLTSWIARHPGGARAITGLCGTDGSEAFNGQHAGGASQAAILTELKIGTLAQ